jgi:hypothetical protein
MKKRSLILLSLISLNTMLPSVASAAKTAVAQRGFYKGEIKVSAPTFQISNLQCTAQVEIADKGNRVYARNASIDCGSDFSASLGSQAYAADFKQKKAGFLEGHNIEGVLPEDVKILSLHRKGKKLTASASVSMPIDDSGKSVNLVGTVTIAVSANGTIKLTARGGVGTALVPLAWASGTLNKR